MDDIVVLVGHTLFIVALALWFVVKAIQAEEEEKELEDRE